MGAVEGDSNPTATDLEAVCHNKNRRNVDQPGSAIIIHNHHPPKKELHENGFTMLYRGIPRSDRDDLDKTR